jgi:peptidoglycan hydrolase-like protein with peptidoglycan-binding domain
MTKSATMGAFALWVAAAAATASVVAAPIAAADSATLPVPGTSSASEALQELNADGYNVMINWLEGHPNVPLSECQVNAIHDPNSSPVGPSTFQTIYVDVTCPNAK